MGDVPHLTGYEVTIGAGQGLYSFERAIGAPTLERIFHAQKLACKDEKRLMLSDYLRNFQPLAEVRP